MFNKLLLDHAREWYCTTKGVWRTRSMLKIRCTPAEVEQTGYRNSQSTESEKAEFHTPAIPNMTRNYVKDYSAGNISQDLVQPTVTTPDTQASASFDFESEEREEITDVPALTPAPALERIEEKSTHTPGSRKATRKNFRKPASSFRDFTCKDTSASGLVDYQFKRLKFELYILYSRAE